MIKRENPEPTLYKITCGNPSVHNKYAMFDLDGVLIDFKTGEFNQQIMTKIRSLTGYSVYIISNQAVKNIEVALTKVEKVLKELNIPAIAFVASKKDIWRKPNTTIFEKYIYTKNYVSSFYVGDAAGRPGDFADSDRKLAYNMFLLLRYLIKDLKKEQYPRFLTETQFITPGPLNVNWRGFNPKLYISGKFDKPDLSKISDSPKPLLLLLVGPPACGKSNFAKSITGSVCILSRDILKNHKKVIAAAKEALLKYDTVIIDNTNPDIKTRKSYLELSENTGIVFFDVKDRDRLRHFSQVRERIDPTRPRIPDVVWNVYYKKLEQPVSGEANFIIKIDKLPLKFKNEREIVMFMQLT